MPDIMRTMVPPPLTLKRFFTADLVLVPTEPAFLLPHLTGAPAEPRAGALQELLLLLLLLGVLLLRRLLRLLLLLQPELLLLPLKARALELPAQRQLPARLLLRLRLGDSRAAEALGKGRAREPALRAALRERFRARVLIWGEAAQ